MIRNGNIVLSQSMTKELGLYVIDDQLETIPFCPQKFYRKYVLDNYPDSPSIAMLSGQYAETILLGSGARGNVVDDLPRKRNGDKRAEHERIEIQMQRLYGFMYAHGVRINHNNTQIRLIAKYAPHIWLRGEMDIFPAIVDGNMSIVDVKTTKDVYSNFFSYREKFLPSCSNHCWGSYDMIAKNQPLFYHFIGRNFHKIGLENMIKFNPDQEEKYNMLFNSGIDTSSLNFSYFVAGVGARDMDNQLSHYQYEMNSHREALLETLVTEAISRINYSIKEGFKAEGSLDVCKNCALKDICTSYIDK